MSAFLSAGIDDLAKYRIVQFFRERPGMMADANSLSHILGLHPMELARDMLEELVERRLLEKHLVLNSPYYRLSSDKELCERLGRLYDLCPKEARVGVLRVLAARSLAKARVRAGDNQDNRSLAP